MEDNLLPLGLLSLLLFFVIIYYAVLWATSEDRRLARIQCQLLQEIARKQGVSEEAITEAYKA